MAATKKTKKPHDTKIVVALLGRGNDIPLKTATPIKWEHLKQGIANYLDMANRFIGELLALYICPGGFIFLPRDQNCLGFVNIVVDGCKDFQWIRLEKVIWSTPDTKLRSFINGDLGAWPGPSSPLF